MIETTYIRLERAAAMLDTDADTLLIAAAEGRVKLYGLLNQIRSAAKNERDEDQEGHWFSHPVALTRALFDFVPLDRKACGGLLRNGTTGEFTRLSDDDQDGLCWEVELSDGEDLPTLKTQHAFMRRADVEAIKAAHATPAPGTIKDAPLPDRSHASDWLMLLNRASRQWWANASKDDPTTQPSKADVVAWLTEKGMNESLANHAATIIRPGWAHTGRKPDA